MRLIQPHDHIVICGNPRHPECTKRRTTGLNNIYYMYVQGLRFVRRTPALQASKQLKGEST